jgi:hypothetical protein
MYIYLCWVFPPLILLFGIPFKWFLFKEEKVLGFYRFFRAMRNVVLGKLLWIFGAWDFRLVV